MASAPLPPPPPPPGWQPSVDPVSFRVTRPGPPRRLWLLLVVVAILAIVIVAISLAVFQSADAVHVQAVDVSFTGASCSGWSSESLNGFNAGTNTEGSFSLGLVNTAPFGSCTAESVAVSTPGFTLLGSDTPFTDQAGQHEVLDVEYQTPGSSFTGTLGFVVTVTTAA